MPTSSSSSSRSASAEASLTALHLSRIQKIVVSGDDPVARIREYTLGMRTTELQHLVAAIIKCRHGEHTDS